MTFASVISPNQVESSQIIGDFDHGLTSPQEVRYTPEDKGDFGFIAIL